jgi:hypothetical protein
MHHSEPDIVASRFIASGRISDESGEFHDGKVPGVGILNHGSDDATLSECATGGATGEDFGGIVNAKGTDGAESVATEESQLTPPMRSSETQNAKAPRTRAASARNARAWNRFLRERIGF